MSDLEHLNKNLILLMAFSSVMGWKTHLSREYVVEQSYITHNQINLTGRGKIWCFYKSTKNQNNRIIKVEKYL